MDDARRTDLSQWLPSPDAAGTVRMEPPGTPLALVV